MNRFFRNTGFYLLIFLVTVGIVNFILSGTDKVGKLTYQDFRVQLQADNITEMAIRPENGTYRVDGTLAKAIPGQESNKFFTNVPLYDSNIISLVEQKIDEQKVKKVEVHPAEGNSIWLTFLTSIIPFVIIFILFFFLLNNAQGGGSRVMNFGKSRAKLYNEEKKRVTFDDVAGADEEKAELEEVVEFLKDPRKFNAVGARIPKGVLLVGPPGTGKTLLARAVAGEAGVPFFSISGSDFVEMFVGVGASRVRDLFENAKKNAPCIIFIDEIDAVGRQRGAGLGGGHDEREQTLNQLLVEMDGFGGNEGIIMVAATNRPDILDPALLRPGRFDRQITVDRPDIKGREAVLKVHARNKPLGEDVKLDVIARGTSGFTGADLENLLNEAALLTARKNKKQINMVEVDEAIDRVIAGPAKKSRVVSEDERRLVAFHEAGHTIIGYHLRNAEMVHKVTIIPRGQAGGYTVMLPKEDRFFATKTDLLDKIVGLLGGRVAEELVLGDISTGAHNDFQRATAIARSMITEYGMSKLGPMQFGKSQGQVFLGRDYGSERNYSDQIAYEIDQEMQNIINECYAKCTDLLTKHRDQLDLIANTLLRVETLDADQIRQLIETGRMENDPLTNSDVVVNIQPKQDETNEEPKQ
ncbi:ATP-dependent zinc metalloprotease FtsH [Brevibacillus centrosporus]|jgi:cell division protease FtsH|uniref:ATP-dependent zinc metalloprotease FtsH n=1 Tax=Brevibacillus centrosporus TaxID=54910 RepID=A0A1I4BV21_9BACL|nr:ATP-dependent zinc metalloprotease FtsH [Brevibacillus centrosporus]MEC2132704.1 ATP-dependent zinc metalloprotease FtsH [Brevibacillus centrosporus]MED4908307.1 ATP-dependent zinc metalloprotease FtsH [Brevibacillus centrosporus]RNB66507.1 ATP-dependent metallopeptidase FtsH/Yme1/Tma family protein [Brevibacillus centrosporus]SFK72638.1 membrane protease FtsH catalytic subunit [Brevibacillus centrosporus]GED33439.1 ATP-dependent zinc metalloprotease FtsH [Brevibacillus centrosporus]